MIFRVASNDLSTIAKQILGDLFAVLAKPGSEENDYIMKGTIGKQVLYHVSDEFFFKLRFISAILRTLVVLNDKAIPLLENILPNLIAKLEVVAKNPSNPHFNHALFESIALSIKYA